MKLNIMEWNVNFGGNKRANICSFAKEYLEESDIIILTEVVENNSIDELFKNEYVTFASKPSNSEWYNQVIVAVRTELQDKLIINKVEIDEKKWNSNELPDILHITIKTCEGRLFNII